MQEKPNGLKIEYLNNPYLVNIILIVAIYLTAELGKILGLHQLPLSISVVWPPTGISLAAVLIFGFKVWPGILLGNFAYDYLHLYPQASTILPPLLTALAVASGSLLQALIGGWIIRRYNTREYFTTLQDITIFLVPAGLLTCMVASTIGVTALYLFNNSQLDPIRTWVTFWLGDSLGVYILTPFIVVWLIQKPRALIQNHPYEAILMFLLLVILSYFTFYLKYPFWHLFIPFTVWVAYVFRMHGATLVIFLISMTAITLTSLGFGPFNNFEMLDPLLVLVSFLEIIVATALILAAVVNERELAWQLLQNLNIDLKQAINMYSEELKETYLEIQEKANIKKPPH
jgi:integral membrane sensor domain MASE1